MFWLLQHYPNIQHAVINDVNARLINVYRVIKAKPKRLISALRVLENEYLPMNHAERTAYFMEKRRRFNDDELTNVEQALPSTSYMRGVFILVLLHKDK